MPAILMSYCDNCITVQIFFANTKEPFSMIFSPVDGKRAKDATLLRPTTKRSIALPSLYCEEMPAYGAEFVWLLAWQAVLTKFAKAYL